MGSGFFEIEVRLKDDADFLHSLKLFYDNFIRGFFCVDDVTFHPCGKRETYFPGSFFTGLQLHQRVRRQILPGEHNVNGTSLTTLDQRPVIEFPALHEYFKVNNHETFYMSGRTKLFYETSQGLQEDYLFADKLSDDWYDLLLRICFMFPYIQITVRGLVWIQNDVYNETSDQWISSRKTNAPDLNLIRLNERIQLFMHSIKPALDSIHCENEHSPYVLEVGRFRRFMTVLDCIK